MIQNWVSKIVSSLGSMKNGEFGTVGIENYSWKVGIADFPFVFFYANCRYLITKICGYPKAKICWASP